MAQRKKTFDEQVIKSDDGHWYWTGRKDKDGYGKFRVDGKDNRAHRIAWERVNGPMPEGMQALHNCDTPPCVRPDHVFPGTNLDNMRDKMAKGRWWSRYVRPSRRKIDFEIARQIRAAAGTQIHIADQFGVSQQLVSRIRAGRAWPE